MSIKFKVIERAQPGVVNGGTKKFYASISKNATVDLRTLAQQISQRSTVNTIDTIAVLEGLLQVIPEQLQLGNLVRLGDLGSMRLSISSEGSEREEEVTAANIKKSKIIFRPGKIIKDTLSLITFSKT